MEVRNLPSFRSAVSENLGGCVLALLHQISAAYVLKDKYSSPQMGKFGLGAFGIN